MRQVLNTLALFGLIVGCGGTQSQVAARDAATRRACDWYQTCGEIGQGEKYPTRDACEVDVRDGWNDHWPAADCDKIQSDDLDICLKAIDIAECGNSADIFFTVVGKCSKENVCNGGNTDGR